jgi:hypothetical protein
MNANAAKHEPPKPPSQATDTTSTTTQPTIDRITRSLQRRRIRLADSFYPTEDNIDTTPYFPIINSCVYELFKDHRSTVSAKAWITS